MLCLHHDDLLAEYFEHVQIFEILKQKFNWPKISAEVKTYTASCSSCKRAKTAQYKLYGELQSLPILAGLKED